MPYIPLGRRKVVGVADTTGNNKGKWTVTFDPAQLSIKVPYFEPYKFIIHGAPGSTFNVFVDNDEWDTSVAGDQNSWEPLGGILIMDPGQTLYFYWSDPTSDGIPPNVTVWLRYDSSIPANQSAGFTGTGPPAPA